MSSSRCPLHCNHLHGLNRRAFLQGSAGIVAGSILMPGLNAASAAAYDPAGSIKPAGPGSSYTPKVKAAFVRRKGEYGMAWPGAVYDGEAAKRKYTEGLRKTAKEYGVTLDIRDVPFYNVEEAKAWVKQAEEERVDGLFLVVLDRQQHAWPSARVVAQSKIRSIIYSPLGTSFTTNTGGFVNVTGNVVYSTNDFSQAQFGLKMLQAAAKMQRTRCLVIRGSKGYDTTLADTGISLRYVPAKTFVDCYNRTKETRDMEKMADYYIKHAQRCSGPSRQDVMNGVRSYYVAGKLLWEHECDAITMDCLGALGRLKVSLPCLAWSRMNDDGIPAICEADTGAVASQILVHTLFGRPGFQQDPVADTADDTIIGAHCCCATKLHGFGEGPEPFDLQHHHGMRDATVRTIWRIGQRVTSVDLLPGRKQGDKQQPSKVLISAGSVADNMNVPPSGGCVVSVKVKFDGNQEVLNFPGFHQMFFYGDYQEQVKDFCQLCGFQPQIV